MGSDRGRAAVSILAIACMLAGIFLIVQAVEHPERVEAQVVRVQGEPRPTASPGPSPYPRQSPDCPAMTNPGGQIRWEPSADAGPWAVEGGMVSIPAIGVEAPIVKVGVNRAAEMVVPRNAHEIAWLDQGDFPGTTNNGVLAGHVNWNRRPGSFARIGSLEPGDRITVAIDGQSWVFEVRWNCAFPFDSDFADQIMGYTNVPSVTLITCGGTYSARHGTHNQRITVRAELVEGPGTV